MTSDLRAYLMVSWGHAHSDLSDLGQAMQDYLLAMALAPWGSR